jgi:tellurite resistance protein TerC
MMKFPKAILIVSAWIVLALLFNAGVYIVQGPQKALEFLTSYIIELSLSVDNLFVFYLIFSHFKISNDQQSKILTWGVLGAQLMRAVFILGGIALLKHLSWVIYAFGLLLIFSGIKIFIKKDKDIHPDQNRTLRFVNRFIPGKLSTFWMALILIELADLVFAVDSIPAVLAITKDPFIVYTSNILAILGLRSMYVVFAPMMNKFHYLHYGLGVILTFVGIKMLTENIWHIPVGYALGFIVLTLGISMSIRPSDK